MNFSGRHFTSPPHLTSPSPDHHDVLPSSTLLTSSLIRTESCSFPHSDPFTFVNGPYLAYFRIAELPRSRAGHTEPPPPWLTCPPRREIERPLSWVAEVVFQERTQRVGLAFPTGAFCLATVFLATCSVFANCIHQCFLFICMQCGQLTFQHSRERFILSLSSRTPR